MNDEKYCFEIGNDGQQSLSLLERLFNAETEYFLRKNGLKKGMRVLDIGCGLGLMSQMIANIVGPTGHVIAIDNNEKQLKAAQYRTPESLRPQITYQCADIYDLSPLGQDFDMVYCRFVLHHINRPRFALSQMQSVLKPGGIYIGIEGIVNHAFSFPEHPAWQSPSFPTEVPEGVGRNPNIGKILPQLLAEVGFNCFEAFIYQPFLIGMEERKMLIRNQCFDNKQYLREQEGLSEQQWQQAVADLRSCTENKEISMAFYAAGFTASKKQK